ncbi:LytR/AlgR family response regulator transcription factor [Algoriphagus terrigena]|uniref:LytR/AlgR family response regulator transcription factor n=1 Tax=Algoriphagus terrigena TaxID=344884 RepID=UPI0012FC05EA|nr:LytTR family DNA-binding domain-containing protein [Algoriphagus terrigena]
MVNKRSQIQYSDQFFRAILCAGSAFLVAMYGNSAHYLDTVSTQSFPVKFLVALFITAFFLEFVHWVTVKLDRRFDWKEKPFGRPVLQFLFGVMLPGLTDYLFLSLYRWYFGLSNAHPDVISQSSASFMIMPIFLFNLYYLVYYKMLKNREDKKTPKVSKKTLLANQGNRTIPIALDEIRYIYHQDRINYLVTSGAKEYVLNESLDELESILSKKDFFRLNRKTIIHYLACSHFQPHGHGKLLIQLEPKFREETVVSQVRAPKFREWINR